MPLPHHLTCLPRQKSPAQGDTRAGLTSAFFSGRLGKGARLNYNRTLVTLFLGAPARIGRAAITVIFRRIARAPRKT